MFYSSFFQFLSWFVLFLLVLLSVAFFTLFERNVIGLVHLRVGPNNVGLYGLLQPLLDAFKLLTKSYTIPNSSNTFPYYISPYLSLSVSLLLWLVVPVVYSVSSMSYSLVVFMCVTSLIVFPLLVSGWASNSKYSLIGCLRSIAQSISYEAVFSTLLVLIVITFFTFSLNSAYSFQGYIAIVVLPLWLFCALAESHRAPFDFSESESELVSGFNTEYIGSLFAFIFLSEYSTLLVTSFLISWLFLGFLVYGILSSIFVALIVSLLIIYIRVTYCRFRYDLLMIAAWNSYLPLSLCLLVGFTLLF